MRSFGSSACSRICDPSDLIYDWLTNCETEASGCGDVCHLQYSLLETNTLASKLPYSFAHVFSLCNKPMLIVYLLPYTPLSYTMQKRSYLCDVPSAKEPICFYLGIVFSKWVRWTFVCSMVFSAGITSQRVCYIGVSVICSRSGGTERSMMIHVYTWCRKVSRAPWYPREGQCLFLYRPYRLQVRTRVLVETDKYQISRHVHEELERRDDCKSPTAPTLPWTVAHIVLWHTVRRRAAEKARQ